MFVEGKEAWGFQLGTNYGVKTLELWRSDIRHSQLFITSFPFKF